MQQQLAQLVWHPLSAHRQLTELSDEYSGAELYHRRRHLAGRLLRERMLEAENLRVPLDLSREVGEELVAMSLAMPTLEVLSPEAVDELRQILLQAAAHSRVPGRAERVELEVAEAPKALMAHVERIDRLPQRELDLVV